MNTSVLPASFDASVGASGSDLPAVAHVFRRLGLGPRPDLALETESVEDAITAGLDLTSPPAPLPEFPVPADHEEARMGRNIQITIEHWLTQMIGSPRLIEERLVWFWHDHFATSLRKVRYPYLMHLQHATVRDHATGNFGDLLGAIARDPAMLIYLDGRSNRHGAINENFAREVMELHTMGHGHHTQDDVVAAARAFSGWAVVLTGDEARRRDVLADPWSSLFIPQWHDAETKTLLGTTGSLDMNDALTIMLEHPATARHIASKLHAELVGLPPDDQVLDDLAAGFGKDFEIMPLVEAIVSTPGFLSQEARWARVRTPIERTIGIGQGFPLHPDAGRFLMASLELVGFFPFTPPNPAGYPGGTRLLGPYQLAHALDLGGLLADALPSYDPDEILGRLGLFGVTARTRDVVAAAPDPVTAVRLAAASPDYALT